MNTRITNSSARRDSFQVDGPSYSRRCSTDSRKSVFKTKKPKIDPWDVEASMEYMDITHAAHFREWVRSEENLHLTAHHLRRVLSESTLECEVRRVANGLRWITSGWATKSVSDLLKLLCKGRSTTWKATLTNLMTAEWPLFPNTAEVVMSMIEDNSPEQASAFVKVVSADWDLEAVSELVFHVGRDFEWDAEKYLKFITSYVFSDSGEEANVEQRERCMKFLFSARSVISEITKKGKLPQASKTAPGSGFTPDEVVSKFAPNNIVDKTEAAAQ
eukprot:CFRG5098T1